MRTQRRRAEAEQQGGRVRRGRRIRTWEVDVEGVLDAE